MGKTGICDAVPEFKGPMRPLRRLLGIKRHGLPQALTVDKALVGAVPDRGFSPEGVSLRLQDLDLRLHAHRHGVEHAAQVGACEIRLALLGLQGVDAVLEFVVRLLHDAARLSVLGSQGVNPAADAINRLLRDRWSSIHL